MTRRPAALALTALVLFGCSKFKKDAGDGGEATGGGGGGLLGMLDKPFEGKIDLQFSDKKSGKPPTPFTYEVKQPKMRFDLPSSVGADVPMLGKSVWALFDPPAKKLYGVMDDPKKAVVFDFDKIGDDVKKAKGGHHSSSSSSSGSSGPQDPPPKFEKTGKIETIAGYECEIWKITEDKPSQKKKEEVELCMAKKIGFFDLRTMGIGSLDPKVAVLMTLTDLNHFPLRAVTSENGVETGRMEATKIEEKKLEDARFAVPADYQIQTLDQMIQGFMPPGMGSGGRPGMPPNIPIPPPPHHK
jgi:Domain of unknown function (DUF4412)